MRTTDTQLFKTSLKLTILSAHHTTREISTSTDTSQVHELLDQLANDITGAILTALTALTKRATGRGTGQPW